MTLLLFSAPPYEASAAEIDQALAFSLPARYPRCFFCGYQIGPDEEAERHYPNPERDPEWSVLVHQECRREFQALHDDVGRRVG